MCNSAAHLSSFLVENQFRAIFCLPMLWKFSSANFYLNLREQFDVDCLEV